MELKLYKYTAIKYACKAIDYGIYAGRLESFNDPYEYRDIQGTAHFRVCCTTTYPLGFPDDINLWAYYGKHRGCCIEFDVPDNAPSGLVKNVEYTNQYTRNAGDDYELIYHNLYRKDADHWKQENETRIVYYDGDESKKSFWNKIGDEIYFKARVTAVIFGLEADIESEETQLLMVKISKYNANKIVLGKIKVSKCMMLDKNINYGFCEDKQFLSDWEDKILPKYKAKGIHSLKGQRIKNEIERTLGILFCIMVVCGIVYHIVTYKSDTRNLLDMEYDFYREGNEYYFGVYEQDNDYTNGKEPIEWVILSQSPDELLLISKHELDWRKYNQCSSDDTLPWSQCSLQSWLNNDFYNTAFSESEKKYIVLSTNMTFEPDMPNKSIISDFSEDYVYILSEIELAVYSNEIKDLQFSPTVYAKRNAVQYDNWDESNIRWKDWLTRSAGQYLFYNCHSKSIVSNNLRYGGFVRPVIRVKL